MSIKDISNFEDEEDKKLCEELESYACSYKASVEDVEKKAIQFGYGLHKLKMKNIGKWAAWAKFITGLNTKQAQEFINFYAHSQTEEYTENRKHMDFHVLWHYYKTTSTEEANEIIEKAKEGFVTKSDLDIIKAKYKKPKPSKEKNSNEEKPSAPGPIEAKPISSAKKLVAGLQQAAREMIKDDLQLAEVGFELRSAGITLHDIAFQLLTLEKAIKQVTPKIA